MSDNRIITQELLDSWLTEIGKTSLPVSAIPGVRRVPSPLPEPDDASSVVYLSERCLYAVEELNGLHIDEQTNISYLSRDLNNLDFRFENLIESFAQLEAYRLLSENLDTASRLELIPHIRNNRYSSLLTIREYSSAHHLVPEGHVGKFVYLQLEEDEGWVALGLHYVFSFDWTIPPGFNAKEFFDAPR